MTQDRLENAEPESRADGAFRTVPEHSRPVLVAHRERLLIGISAAAAIALVIGGVNAYFNHEIGIARTIVFWTSLALFSATPVVVLRTRSIELGAALLVLGSVGPVFVPAYYQGGLQSPYLIWFVVIPILAPLFLGRRFAIFSGAVGVTCYTVFYALELSGGLPAPPVEGADFSSYFNLVLAAIFGTIVGIATDRSSRRASADLEVLRSDVLRKAFDLSESEARKSAILDASLSGVVSCDSHGRITEFNPAAERMFGYTRAEALRRDVGDLLVPQAMMESHRRGFARYVRTGRSRILDTAMEVLGRCADGREIPVELLVQRIGLKGEPQFTATLRDLRQQRLAEATLRRRGAELQRSQRLEGVGRLAGGVAHDFNNLLTIIGGYSESIADLAESDAAIREDAEEITRAVGRAAHITQQLLAFSRRQDLELGEVDLTQLLKDFETTLGTMAPSHIELVLDLEEAPWHVTADALQAERIAMNLVLNACDAIENTGTVSLSLSYVGIDVDDSWRPDHLEPGSYARLEVQDTGCGMDAETLARVFEPFFTTKEIGKGTGLGLATVYGIVRQFGGHIDIDSSPGNGTRVLVYFPRAEADERSRGLMDSDTLAGGSATVLLVDDESGIRKIMATQLRKQGYEVIEAADGEEALTAGTAEGVRVDLLVTDIVMPRLDGPAVATALIKVFPQMKIVLMSGYSESMNTELDLLLPDAEFLEKPLRMSELAETAERLLASTSNGS